MVQPVMSKNPLYVFHGTEFFTAHIFMGSYSGLVEVLVCGIPVIFISDKLFFNLF